MIGYIYTITNKDGDSFKINDHVTDPLNFLALQQYPDMDIDVKNSELPLDGQHGIWDFFSFFGKRRIAFSGVIIGEDEESCEEQKNLVNSVLALPTQPEDDNDGYVTISWTDATGAVWSIQGKIDRAPKFSRNMKQTYMLDFLISFKSADPFILSADIIDEDGIRGYFAYGVKFPIELPALMGYVAINGLPVDNDGSIYAQTVIRIYGEAGGDITNPTITNQTTGKVFKVNTTISGTSEYIEIDSKEGTVVNEAGDDLSGDIDEASEFILLKPGVNEIVYSSDDPTRVPEAIFSVVFRSTKI